MHNCYKGLLAGAFFALPAANQANASEFITPLLGGLTIGVPTGAAAPPGLYYGNTAFYLKGTLRNGSGAAAPLTVSTFATAQALFLYTDLKFFGASYYVYAGQPVKHTSVDIAGQNAFSTWGIFNTIVSPLNLSWDLGHDFYASYGLTFLVPDATYSPAGGKTGNGYFTTEQAFAVSYLHDGYNLTANLTLDLNAKNTRNNYRSGNDLGVDFTATKAFGKFQLGVGGYIVEQFADDKINGVVVPASNFQRPRQQMA